MDESAYASWPNAHALMKTARIVVAEPDGEPRSRKGWTIIGVIWIPRVGIHVIPCWGLSDAYRRVLVIAAFTAWLDGPLGPQWLLRDDGRWVSQIRVRHLPDWAAASSVRSSSSDGAANSQF